MLIDLNADLGEGAGNDRALMPYLSSANLSCGEHAGSPDDIRETARLALERGLRIGAHPGYPDRENFGRRSIQLDDEQLRATLQKQVKWLKSLVESLGGKLTHVKPHGALYNDIAFDRAKAQIVAQAIHDIDPGLVFVGLANSPCLEVARELGLPILGEFFADRSYTADGRLVGRDQPHALIHDAQHCLQRVRQLVERSTVTTETGSELPVDAGTVCLHGDSEQAIAFAAALANDPILKGAAPSRLRYHPLGDSAFSIRFEQKISPQVHRAVQSLAEAIAREGIPGLIECVPSYAEIVVHYNPQLLPYRSLLQRLKASESQLAPDEPPSANVIEIPVCYEPPYAPDLEHVARHNDLTTDQVIALHSNPSYRVYMLGFTPGFPYLGGLDPRLATPRQEKPRLRVEAGSVGIAGEQTGIYPIASPGGWQVIGRSPFPLFAPESAKPFPIEPGDHIRFKPISQTEFVRLHAQTEPATTQPTSSAKSPPSVSVLNPGQYTTVQDRGRIGYQRYGMPVSGAMDHDALATANALLGNLPEAAALEATYTGPTLVFHRETTIALAGADFEARLNDHPIKLHQAISVSTGDKLTCGKARQGARLYIAFSGGIDLPPVMGSRSTYARAAIGGLCGRPLKRGDTLALLPAKATPSPRPPIRKPLPGPGDAIIRIIAGPEAKRFTTHGLSQFLSGRYCVAPESDRMGIRLRGNAIERKDHSQMLSAGTAFGSIQVPPDGLPIILMADRQTTGGYPRIANVITADLPQLAQLAPGATLRFREVTLDIATQLA